MATTFFFLNFSPVTGSTPPNPLVAGDFGEMGVNGELVEAEAGPSGEEDDT